MEESEEEGGGVNLHRNLFEAIVVAEIRSDGFKGVSSTSP
jgi:hypothetical protein